MTARLNVNIDHVATVRQARRAPEPSVVAAAMICEQSGADGITIHLRGDRRFQARVSVVNAQQVELCTAAYAESTLGSASIHGEGAVRANQELRRLREGAALAAQYGLHVAAGHGLTTRNVGAVARISEVSEFNIGHHIVSRAVFIGLAQAVREMREAIAAVNHLTPILF